MRQFATVFRYEFFRMVSGKSYRVITVLLMLALALGLSLPRFSGGGEAADPAGADAYQVQGTGALAARGGDGPALLGTFQALLPGVTLTESGEDEATLRHQVEAGDLSFALIVEEGGAYTLIEGEGDAFGMLDAQVSAALTNALRTRRLVEQGLSPEAAATILAAEAQGQVERVGGDPMEHFMSTYVLIFLLYMAIMLYGSMVASGVGVEKTTRAMEILITSAKPTHLMFGKVLGLGMAGLLQLVLILLTGKIAYMVNAAYWAGSPIVAAIFDMSPAILGYTVLFFLLGFFIYAFLYGAVGSLVNRTEDLSSAIMPVTLLYIVAFVVVVMGTTTGQVDSGTMRLASFIPFSSPMAMFARIAMGQPALWEVLLSLGILVGSVVLVGYASAGIYRLGVLLYGQKASPQMLWAAIRRKNL